MPLLQAGTIAAVLGYLIGVQPLIAATGPAALFAGARDRAVAAADHQPARPPPYPHRAPASASSWCARSWPARAPRAGSTPGRPRVRARLASYRLKYGLTFLGNLLDALGPLAVLGFGGWLVTQGQTSVGALLVFITGFQKVGDPLDQLMSFYRTTQNALVKYRLIAAALAGDGKPEALG